MNRYARLPGWDNEQEKQYRLERLVEGTDDIQHLQDLLACNPNHPYRAGIEAAMAQWQEP